MKLSLVVLCLSLSCTALAIQSLKQYIPDFDTALGKHDFYFNRYYKDRGAKPFISFARNLYEQNKLSLIPLNNKLRIPRIIHQIWIGSPLPAKYKKWQKTWQSWSGWEYKLWTNKEVEKLQLVNRDLFEAATTYGQKADILRIELLKQFGGLYVDMDFECLNADIFDTLHKCYNFYTGVFPLDCITLGVNNAIIGSVPNHPILVNYLKEMRNVWHQKTENLFDEVVVKTGPGLFTKVFASYAHAQDRVIALPPTFFYPLGGRQNTFLKRPPADVLKQKVCKPESVAIHWWARSWSKPAKKKN
jgi:inositol phosphorylceramide mannosyltransferase catalytic subunit